MKKIERVGIVANREIPGAEAAVRKAIATIRDAKSGVFLDTEMAAWLAESATCANLAEVGSASEIVLVFGGDGTFLRAARDLVESPVPLLGINMGSLGFLTYLRLADMQETLTSILSGRYTIEQRMRLKATIERDGEPGDSHLALNDAVVNMSRGSRLVEFGISVGGEYLGGYRADGLIIATPTGSTAYSMSAGGPIVHPTMNALIATPISPHALSIRPIVLSGEEEIVIKIGEHSGEAGLTLDGSLTITLHSGDAIHVRKASRSQPIIRPESLGYYGLVREKLGWGGVPGER